MQFGQGSTDRASGGCEEDYEALQHSSLSQADVSRAQTLKALEARECMNPTNIVAYPPTYFPRSSVSATSSFPRLRICKSSNTCMLLIFRLILASYFVTELLGTDLHRLLTSRPLEKQFIQYFLYQILVRYNRGIQRVCSNRYGVERTEICAFCRRHPS